MGSTSNRRSSSSGSLRDGRASRTSSARRHNQERRSNLTERRKPSAPTRQGNLNEPAYLRDRKTLDRTEPRKRKTAPVEITKYLPLLALPLLIAVIAVAVYFSPLFTIKTVEANAIQRVSPITIGTIAEIPSNTTLLRVDSKGIKERLEANPWIEKVEVVKAFPSTLKLIITESQPVAMVSSRVGQETWYISKEGTWLAPVALQEGETGADVAIREGMPLIKDAPDEVTPEAGKVTADPAILGSIAYLTNFTDFLSSQVLDISAPSKESISLTLKSGVEVAVGEPTNFTLKEQVISMLLDQHRDEVTYINVRVPNQPAWRGIAKD